MKRVACVMCTRDRPALMREALACYLRQDHANRGLLIYDNGVIPPTPEVMRAIEQRPDILYLNVGHAGFPLNVVMSKAMDAAVQRFEPDYLCKWDDDDWSASDRVSFQVEHAQRVGKWVVGFNELPFYDENTDEMAFYSNPQISYACGTSLLIHRRAWKLQKFPDTSPKVRGGAPGLGSDTHFTTLMAGRGQVVGVDGTRGATRHPLMVARLHKGNSNARRGGMRKMLSGAAAMAFDLIYQTRDFQL